MADIRLGRYEIEHYDPPPVCARCGAPSVVCKDHRFQWAPPWIYILLVFGVIPYAIAAGVTMRRMVVPIPLCERHKWHWGGRTAVVLLGLVGVFLVMFGGIALGNEVNFDPAFVFIPVGLLFLVWIVGAVILAVTTIRPREITDKSITLSGVSQEFIDALNEARRGQDDEDDGDRPRRRRRGDEEDADDRRSARGKVVDDDGGYYDPDEEAPRRRPPSDAIEEGGDR
jgi:hypothetical protein